MAGYSPLKITGNSTGLVQQREEFLLPDDAYPTLQNAYIFRERIKRKKGFQLLGRLQRNIGTTNGGAPQTITISPHPIQSGIASFVIGSIILTDPGTTTPSQTLLTNNASFTGTLNRTTGVLSLSGFLAGTAVQYFPGLPVMGIRTRELQNSANDQTIFFDQDYAYTYNGTTGQFQEFISGTTWNAANLGVSGIDFFWSTNYWMSDGVNFGTTGIKLFWETNNSGHSGANADPPRITDGTTWLDFYHDTVPTTNSPWAQINTNATPAAVFLTNWLTLLPFRGRMVVFNTWEGISATSSQNFSNRIRWSTIGNPFIPYTNTSPAAGSWRDDIRGQGGYLDIPTSEDIISVGFVRDNLVVYCERSTWQLRYTGRSIAPFQIERVNSEIGAESTFAAIQFDTSLVSIGDKGILECDSYKAERIDIKIPDFVFQFNSLNNGVARVQGIRDFPNRLAYWTIPLVGFYPNVGNTNWIFPTARLLYNYENDSWAIFNDSLTALGTFQLQNSPNWLQIPQTWIEYEQTWLDDDVEDALIVGGNQQGFIEILDQLTVNDASLFISNLVNNGSGIAQITSPNHNLQSGFIISINGIPATTPFSVLNGGIYQVVVIDQNNFTLLSFDIASNQFDIPVVGSPAGTYQGGGLITIRENFSITSKKFNFLDEGQNIQLGYLDILMSSIANGEITLNVYLNYDDENPSNTLYQNQIVGVTPQIPDTFFNSVIPTYPSEFAVAQEGTKFWQRVICPTRANFLTLQYTFSPAQMAGAPQQNQVQIDAQILWIRKAGRITQL
jgi:hypothetical protein